MRLNPGPPPSYNPAALRPGSLLRRALPVAAGAALIAPAPAFAGFFTPEHGGSPNADSIYTLYVITLVIATIVLAIVWGALGWSLFRYRARKGLVADQIHGNTTLEVGWTVAAALILVVLTTVTFIKLGSITNPPATASDGFQGSSTLVASTDVPKPPDGKGITICVTGRQYIWRYTYAPCSHNALGETYSYEEMVVPAKTTVVLDIQSTDVIHSWWIPKMGGKKDAVPGYHNYTWFQAPKAGVTYTGQCAELCGRNHANMTARVRVVTPTEYQAWLDRQKQLIDSANKALTPERAALQRSGDLSQP
jgi:cytochrome c oxidase subunit 2